MNQRVTPKSSNDKQKPANVGGPTHMRLVLIVVTACLFVGPAAATITTPVGVTSAPWTAWIESRASGGGDNFVAPRLALDHENVPHILYSNQPTYYASRGSLGWTEELVMNHTAQGALAFDSHDVPHAVVWGYADPHSVYYATRTAPGVWTVETIETGLYGAQYFDMKIDRNDHPHVAYTVPFGSVHYATKPNSLGSWIVTTVNIPDAGLMSLAVDSHGLARLVSDGDAGETYAQEQPNGSFTTELVGGSPCGTDASIAIDSNDVTHVTCGVGGLRYYTRTATGAWSMETIETLNDRMTSLALDSHDRPHVAYTHGADTTPTLGYATKTDAGWVIETPATGVANVYDDEIAIDSHDRPLIAFSVTCLDGCVNPLGLGESGHDWLVEPASGASPGAFAALTQNIAQAAGLP